MINDDDDDDDEGADKGACVGAGAIAVQVTVCAQFVGWSADHRGRRKCKKCVTK